MKKGIFGIIFAARAVFKQATLPLSRLRLLHCALLLALFFLAMPLPAISAEFIPTGSLNVARQDHTATLLTNGKILIAGGYKDTLYLSSAELYDPAAGTFTPTGSMAVARGNHTATLLPDGRVLVTGGQNTTGTLDLSSAEIYDPATGTFTPAGNMTTSRAFHTATLLSDGRVLIAGGSGNFSVNSSAEIYDPADGKFHAAGDMSTSRTRHTATLLRDGTVLIAGGSGKSAELYDPATGFSRTGDMVASRSGHTANLLNDGTVLIAGGDNQGSAEIYDPASGTFRATGTMSTLRKNHAAVLLNDGKVLVAGGENDNTWEYLYTTEIYDPASGAFAPAGNMSEKRADFTATAIPASGLVLIAGGYHDDQPLSGAETYVSGITMDTTPPDTAIEGHPAITSNLSAATFAFSANEPSSFECRIDDSSYAECTSPMTYMELADGNHTFSVRAVDSAGNIDPTPAEFSWRIDTVAPSTTASPPGGLYNAAQMVTLSAGEEAIIYYTTDGSTPTAGSATYNTPISIPATTTLKYFAMDKAGNSETVKTETYSIDLQAPILVVSTLTDGQTTGYSILNVSGNATDSGGIKTVTINGVEVPLDGNGSFSYPVNLQEGKNTITIVAVDQAGNTTTETRTIYYDPAAPAVTITSPPDNSFSNINPVEVDGTFEGSAVSVKVNDGQPGTAELSGNGFSYKAQLAPGMNTIEVTVTESDGRSATAKRTIVYDGQKPGLAVTDPAQDTITNQQSILLKGTASDDLSKVSVTIAMDGYSFTPDIVGSSFQQPLTFSAEKTYTVTVKASDEAGNTSEVRRNIVYSLQESSSGNYTLSDALNAYKIYLGLTTATAADASHFDVAPLGPDGKPKGNGIVNAADVVMIMRSIVGLESW